MKLKEIQKLLSQLTLEEQEAVTERIYEMLEGYNYNLNNVENVQREKEGYICPYCSSNNTKKNGVIKGVQRHLCKECGKNYRSNTGTATAHLKKKEKFKSYIIHFLAGKSIRACASLTGISIQTSFDWRHKILSSLQKQQDSTMLGGVCESDEIFFTFSEKGNKNLKRKARKRGKSIYEKKKRGISDEKLAVIISSDRTGNKHIKVAKRGRIRKKDIENALKGRIEPNTVLCTDAHRSYTAFAKSNNIEHHTIKVSAKELKRGIYHVQNVNFIAKDLRDWLSQFGGVSSKYLQNYLNWYSMLESIKQTVNAPRLIAGLVAASTSAWQLFQNIHSLEYLF